MGDDGLRWLKLHCINLVGILKKESNFARVAYADEILPKILESANNPLSGNYNTDNIFIFIFLFHIFEVGSLIRCYCLGEMWWTKSEEPWQTLSACIEIRNALQTGKFFTETLRICNESTFQ